MAEKQTLATYFTEGILPYDPADKKQDGSRLMRMNDAKGLLREAAAYIDAETPAVWQLLIAQAMQYAGDGILTFMSGLKARVRLSGWFDSVVKRLFPQALPLLEPYVAKYAELWGVRTVTGLPVWQSILKWFTPTPQGTVEDVVVNGGRLTNARRLAEMVDRALVRGYLGRTRREFVIREGKLLLPQTQRKRRKRKLVRSRKKG